MAFDIACIARVQMNEVRVVCQRRVAEQQGACRRERVREVGISGCFRRLANRPVCKEKMSKGGTYDPSI
jgi:hypothetical protein